MCSTEYFNFILSKYFFCSVLYLDLVTYDIHCFVQRKKSREKNVLQNHVSIFSSHCQRQCQLLPSLGVRRPLTFHI